MYGIFLPLPAVDVPTKNSSLKKTFAEAPAVTAPSTCLDSLLLNLLSNAIKYRSTNRTPQIHVFSEPSERGTVLAVHDNGLGIDLQRHGKDLFKMSKVFHAHPDAKGFGLYLTKVQVVATGGRIWAQSTPDEGSTFFIEFPA